MRPETYAGISSGSLQGAGLAQAQSQPDKPRVHSLCEQNDIAYQRLQQVVAELETRLIPILRPAQPAPSTKQQAERESQSPIADVLTETLVRTERISDIISDLLRRMEV